MKTIDEVLKEFVNSIIDARLAQEKKQDNIPVTEKIKPARIVTEALQEKINQWNVYDNDEKYYEFRGNVIRLKNEKKLTNEHLLEILEGFIKTYMPGKPDNIKPSLDRIPPELYELFLKHLNPNAIK